MKKKETIIMIVLAIVFILSSIVLFLNNKNKTLEKKELNYGDIKKVFNEPHSRTMDNLELVDNGFNDYEGKIETYREKESEFEKSLRKEKEREQKEIRLEDKIKCIDTSDEKFKIIRAYYRPKANSFYVFMDMYNMSTVRKKAVTVTAYDKIGEEIAKKTIYQNSLANVKVNYTFDIKMNETKYGSDINTIKIEADEIEKDYLH